MAGLGMPMGLQINPMNEGDWQEVRAIYREGIGTGNATFEEDVSEWERHSRHPPPCALVARKGKDMSGWAPLAPVSTRKVYRGVAEVSIYVRREHHRQGVGTALIVCSEDAGIWTLQAGVFPTVAAYHYSRRMVLSSGTAGTPWAVAWYLARCRSARAKESQGDIEDVRSGSEVLGMSRRTR